MNPYDVLGIDPPADDAAVRARYLELVREFPPEQHPERFAEINRAYAMIQDDEQRLRHTLFPPLPEEKSPLEVTVNHLRKKKHRTPLNFDEMKHYLQKCAMD